MIKESKKKMFSANYFTYDDVFSGTYGLYIADFNDSAVTETAAFTPTLNTIKPSGINRFFHNGITYESAPSYQFSFVSEIEIPDTVRREILTWLVGRKEYKKLKIHQVDLENYYYNCVFTSADIIYVNGKCHGFRVTATFDSHFARMEPIIITEDVTTETKRVTFMSYSDIPDSFSFPIVEFTSSEASANAYLEIKHVDTMQTFRIEGPMIADEKITVDGETRTILSTRGGERLSYLKNKQWLKIISDNNNRLDISSSGGTVKIYLPQYAMIGF